MGKQHNWAPAQSENSYAGFLQFVDGCVAVGRLGERRVSKTGKGNYPLTLEEDCSSVILPTGEIGTVSEGGIIGVPELPCLRHLSSIQGRIVRLTHIATQVRGNETRSRITVRVEVAPPED
jgi:hypothetical protein